MNEKQSKLCITFMYFPSLLYIKITKSKEQMSEYTNKDYQMICLILKIMRKCVFWKIMKVGQFGIVYFWKKIGPNSGKVFFLNILDLLYKNESISRMTTITTSDFCCRIFCQNGIVPLGKKNAEKG